MSHAFKDEGQSGGPLHHLKAWLSTGFQNTTSAAADPAAQSIRYPVLDAGGSYRGVCVEHSHNAFWRLALYQKSCIK